MMLNTKTSRKNIFLAVVAVFLTGTAAYGIELPNKTDKQAEETKTEAPEDADRKKAEELYLQYEEYESNDESEKAVECLRQAAELGHDKAQVLYAYTCMTEDRIDEGIKWYRAAAVQGNTMAPTLLGRIYFEEEQKINMKEAARWFRKGAEQGATFAQRMYGICCFEGYGVTQDRAEAVKWFRKAAEQTIPDSEALYMLGVCYRDGLGVDQDRAEAVKWFRKGAGHTDDYNAYGLGVCCMEGYGVDQDMKEAVKWFLKAAEQGDAKAQCAFGFCCLKKYGGAAGKAEAVEWFGKAIDGLRKAAENGDPEAQTLLSECYGDGNGVKQDRTLSRIWLRKAAEQDFASAQLELAILLFVEDKNMKEADKWFRKAVENGESAAEGFMERHFPDPEDAKPFKPLFGFSEEPDHRGSHIVFAYPSGSIAVGDFYPPE